MASRKWISHFTPGILGKYIGHSIVHEGDSILHEDGEVEHFRDDGSIIPGETYVGRSKIENDRPSRGGGGGGGGLMDGLGLIFLPFLICLGLIALGVGMVVGPTIWLIRRFFFRGKREASAKPEDKHGEAGWALLGLLLLVISVGSIVQLLTVVLPFMVAEFTRGTPASQWALDLLICAIGVTWSFALLVGAIDILRKNRIRMALPVVALLAGIGAIGYFVATHNRPPDSRARPTAKAATQPGALREGEPRINAASTIAPEKAQAITIAGSGFGSRPPYVGNSNCIRITDRTKHWNAGSSRDFPADQITLSVVKWTDTEIQIGGFSGAYGGSHYSLGPGDQLTIQIWNPQTGRGPAMSNATVVQAGSPDDPPDMESAH